MDGNKLEELTYQIISLLKKWQLWDSIDIFCNGKFYSSYPGDVSLFSRPSTRGFRDLDDVWVGLSNQNGMDEYLSYYIDPPENDPLEEIPDGDIPLADVPQTGDMSIIWFGISALSGLGLAGVKLFGKKKDDEE